MEGGFNSLCLLNQLTNLELTNVYIQGSQLLTTLASTDQLISLKLCRMILSLPYHNNLPNMVSTWDQLLMLDLMKTIAKMTRLCCLHLDTSCGLFEDDHVSALLPICSQLQELELIDDRKWKSPQSILSDESIVFIANHCQDLKFLNISGHQKLTSKVVNEVLEKCPKLESITVDYTCVNLNYLKKRPNGFPLLEIRKAQWGFLCGVNKVILGLKQKYFNSNIIQ